MEAVSEFLAQKRAEMGIFRRRRMYEQKFGKDWEDAPYDMVGTPSRNLLVSAFEHAAGLCGTLLGPYDCPYRLPKVSLLV